MSPSGCSCTLHPDAWSVCEAHPHCCSQNLLCFQNSPSLLDFRYYSWQDSEGVMLIFKKQEGVEKRQSDLSFIVLGLYVPCTIPPKHVPRKHVQKRSTEGMNPHSQVCWAITEMVRTFEFEEVEILQHKGMECKWIPEYRDFIVFGGAAMVGWAPSLVPPDIKSMLRMGLFPAYHLRLSFAFYLFLTALYHFLSVFI